MDRGLQHDRIVLDLAPHEVARELYGQRNDFVFDSLLERLERLRERLTERRQPRDAGRELGFPRREPFIQAALPRLVLYLPL